MPDSSPEKARSPKKRVRRTSTRAGGSPEGGAATASPPRSPALPRPPPKASALATSLLTPTVAPAPAATRAYSGSDGPSRVGTKNSWDTKIALELAEGCALEAQAQALRASIDSLAQSTEIDLAESALAQCEAALAQAVEQAADERRRAAAMESEVRDLREAKLRAQKEVDEVRLLMKADLARQTQLQQALKEANGRCERQVAEFRKAAEATAAERSREVETRSERIRIWTDRVERFIEAGYEKRIDPVLFNANSEIYTGLVRLLNKEEALLFQQTKVLGEAFAASGTAEADELRGRLASAEAQRASLATRLKDFDVEMKEAFKGFFHDELASAQARVRRLDHAVASLQQAGDDSKRQAAARHAKRRDEVMREVALLRPALARLEEAVAGIVQNTRTLAEDDPRRALAEEQAVTKAVRAELAAAVAAKEEAVAAARAAEAKAAAAARAKAVVDEQLRARALEFGEKEMLQREIARAAERTAAAEVEREALLAEGDASRAQDAVTMAKKGGEIEALRAQAAGMAAALTKYATMEAAWVEEREEGARKLAKLKRERRELAKTAARVDDAEAKLAASSHSALVEARKEVAAQRRRVDQLSGELEEARAETAALRARAAEEAAGLRAEGSAAAAARHAADWVEREANEERAAVLVAQLGKLKEGLTRRVIVQWSMRGLLRCHKAWALYALQRRLRRQIGGASAEPLSGDETDAPPPGVAGQLLATIGDFF